MSTVKTVSGACGRGAMMCALVLFSANALAGGFHNADIGAKRMGQFFVVANNDDVTSIFHNPATLVNQHGTNFYHSQSWFFANLAFKLYDSKGNLWPRDHDLSPDWSIGWIPFVGVNSDLGTKNWRLAAAIYSPNAYGAAMPEDELTRYHATNVLFIAARATAAVAYDFSDKLALGFGVSLVPVYLNASRYLNGAVLNNSDAMYKPYQMAANESDPDVAAQVFKDEEAKLKKGDMPLNIEGLDFTWAWEVGVVVKPTKWLRIGMSFESGSKINLEGEASLTQPDGAKKTTTQHTTMVIPFALRGGISVNITPDFEIGSDIRYWHYQIFQEQLTTLDEPLGPISELRDIKNYGNSWGWCIGMNYRIIPELELMAGFQQDFTPIPEESYSLENPSRDQLGVSLGTRWHINDRWFVTLSMVRNWFNLVDVQTSQSLPPTNAKGNGDNFEVGFDFNVRL